MTARENASLDIRLGIIAASLWIAAAWGISAGVEANLWAALAALAVAAWGCLRLLGQWRPKHRSRPPAVLPLIVLTATIIALVLSTNAYRTSNRQQIQESLDGTEATVTVRLEKEPAQSGDRVLAPATLVSVNGQALSRREPVLVLADPAWLAFPFGAQVRTGARINATDPGDDRVFLLIAAGKTEIHQPAGWRRYVAGVRSRLAAGCQGLSPAGRGLVPGIALGDTRGLDSGLKEYLRTTSLTHLTAISGAHVAMMLSLVLLALLWAPPWVRTVAGGAATIGFIALVRPEGSVLRASVMGAVMLCALVLRRPRSGLPALAAAVVALVWLDPWIARSFGFALSVLATLALFLLAPPLAKTFATVMPRPLALACAIPLAAQLGCTPVLLLLQPEFPTWGVLANIVTAPVIPAATVLGVGAALVTGVWPAGAAAGIEVASWCAQWVATVASTMARWPVAAIPWPLAGAGVAALAVVGILLRLAVQRCRLHMAG